MKVLGIIPARGGSKGVPRKNIRAVDGIPLIAYAIQCAQQSKLLTHFIVNTDDEEIASVSQEWGAEVMMRPPELATDTAPIIDVAKHIVANLKCPDGTDYDLLVFLQATAPIRTGQDVDNIIRMFQIDPALDGVISVVPMQDMHPARMYHLTSDQHMVPFLGGESETVNRQQLEPVYFRNGCFYAVKTTAMLRENKIMAANKKAYVMPAEWLANIDDERDLLITEVMVKQWKLKHEHPDH